MIEWIFYIFATTLLTSAICVISLRNTVHSALFLVFCFFNAACLFLIIGAEYIAMTLIIVYVGAVTVLFLFVIMMLDIQKTNFKQKLKLYLPLTLFLSAIVFVELIWTLKASEEYFVKMPEIFTNKAMTNVEAIGRQLYTKYFMPFQISGIILLVAIIGSIMTTVRHSRFSKKQSIYNQLIREKEDCIELIDAEISKGVKL